MAKKKPTTRSKKKPAKQPPPPPVAFRDAESFMLWHCFDAISEMDEQAFFDFVMLRKETKTTRAKDTHIKAIMRFATLGWQQYWKMKRDHPERKSKNVNT